MSALDWKRLLVAYIGHVCEEEGSDFLLSEIDGITPVENIAIIELALGAFDYKESYVELLRRHIERLKAMPPPPASRA
jgi:hypothetical protein